MPIYEFCCPACGVKERLLKMKDSKLKQITCDECGRLMIKIPSASSFELKGGGWYDSGYTKSS